MFVLVSLLVFGLTFGRPIVRNVRTHDEFQRLIKHHKEVTGLPVVVDFYSDGCGPCRMIAPFYKQLAKQYKDRAVFAKVDVNRNRETSGWARIRSMPTFQFYMDGKKKHQFSGADQNQLQQYTERLARQADKNNVRITIESLKSFYERHAPDKAIDENLQKVMEKAGGEEGGPGHRKLANALQKKYGESPETVTRAPKTKSSKPNQDKKPQTKTRPANENPLSANLHLASLEDLLKEVEKRKADAEEKEFEQQEENSDSEEEEDEEDDKDSLFKPWIGDEFAERIVIIGGGPAGLSAAIYAARSGLNPVVVAPPAGGQLQGKGVMVENYPAVLDSTGPEVVFEMMKQAAKYGATFHDEEAVEVDLFKKMIKTNSSTLKTQSIIIATGADSRWLGVEGEQDLRGGGVSACATCDGYLYKDQHVVVVGGGDTAMEEALHLARTSSKVTLIHRREAFRASNVLARRVMENDKIKIMWNTTVIKFEGAIPTKTTEEEDSELEDPQAELTHVILKKSNGDGTASAEEVKLECSGAFVAIGHDPNTNLFKDQLNMADTGYIKVVPFTTKTSVEGVFAAGDVADSIYRQAITSAGTGAMAALDAERWLAEMGLEDERAKYEEEFMKELMNDIEEEDEKKNAILNEEECDE
eukprot:CAMPEP_0204837870 /NCGR_PEP_ID=MMETSP1346-20131115/29296_1 /ASSEMBLY_ACC=CAM_ASM_000771 /TAXON_ID=215587 /ORGANISM="Aplanochytrium stocchinoi, Strain GSBS06" /LENGTH=642 /DNA_ID=CAMNT_0051973593 /DNA_START=116 /DNA_END=2044 /DNA_ORIENTATION=-